MPSPPLPVPRLRLVVPTIDLVDRNVFAQPPLSDWAAELRILGVPGAWPDLSQLEELRDHVQSADGIARPCLVAQTPALLADGLHYEERIHQGRLATREQNWHDLLNALAWLRYPRIKHALNVAQCADIAEVGRRQRTRAQCAMTHFDEGGAIVLCSDPQLLALWDCHDWQGLFWRERSAWGERIAVQVYGHALLELALQPERLLTAKCIVLMTDAASIGRVHADPLAVRQDIDARIADLIAARSVLADPQDLRPLPLSGIPGWHPGTSDQHFFSAAPCFRPLRPGRRYPPASTL